MAVREIVTYPDVALRRKARKVNEFGPDLQKLIDDMVETMREAPGVGLAAPQVDVSSRVIVVEFGDEEDEDIHPKLYVVVNPEIIRPSSETNVGTEGCLSVPGFVGDVERPEAITLRGLNRHRKPIRMKAKGWLARIFQHEVDHLNGILFIDLAEKVYRLEEETAQVIPAD
jgi:peptide deformylase